jgi:hypothetical protein
MAGRRSSELGEHTRLRDVRDVDEDVVSGVTVEWCAEPLLVEVVTDETDRAPEDEQAVEGADLDVLVRLLGRERARVAEKVDEAHGNATVNVQDERVLLRGRDLLDCECVVEERV